MHDRLEPSPTLCCATFRQASLTDECVTCALSDLCTYTATDFTCQTSCRSPAHAKGNRQRTRRTSDQLRTITASLPKLDPTSDIAYHVVCLSSPCQTLKYPFFNLCHHGGHTKLRLPCRFRLISPVLALTHVHVDQTPPHRRFWRRQVMLLAAL